MWEKTEKNKFQRNSGDLKATYNPSGKNLRIYYPDTGEPIADIINVEEENIINYLTTEWEGWTLIKSNLKNFDQSPARTSCKQRKL